MEDVLSRRRLFTAILYAVAVLVPLGSRCRASDPLPGYSGRVWQASGELPEDTIQAFAQTPDGYLWIGTTAGLLRFDGSQFITFNRDNTPSFAENGVFCLLTAHDGTLWIGTEGGGLIRYIQGTFRRIAAKQGLTDGFVHALLQDRHGRVWVGTNNGVFRLSPDEEKVVRIDKTPGFPSIAVHALMEDASGRLWVGGSYLIALGTQKTIYTLSSRYSENRVKSLLQTSDGTVWVGTVSGLERLVPGAVKFNQVAGIHATVRVLSNVRGHGLWIGTIGKGVYIYRDEKLALATPSTTLPSKTILSIFDDHAANLWIGTEAGMARFSPTPVKLLPLPNTSDFETISLDRDNTLWIASTKLFHVVNGIAKPYLFPEVQGARIRNVYRQRDGSLWLGTDGQGLFHVGPTPKHFTVTNGLVNNFVRGMLEASNGEMWIATDEGVSEIRDNAVVHNYDMRNGLSYLSVRDLCEDGKGDLWIGTEHGLNHLHHGRFVSDAATQALHSEKVWKILQGKDGTLWFGTRTDGLFSFRDGVITRYTTADGLSSDSILSLLEDKDGHLWVGSPNNISLFDRDALEQSKTMKRPVASRVYTLSSPTNLGPLFGGTQPSAAITPAGEVWFPAGKGAVRISPPTTGTIEPVTLRIDHVLADGHRLESPVALDLPARNATLEISYAALMLGSQADLRFMYKLDGFDRDWYYAGTRRTAYYTNLHPGHYIFRVRLIGQGDIKHAPEASLSIMQHQFFYRQAWFLVLCIVLVTLIIWQAHQARLRRLGNAMNAVIEERARLAREIHDTLIQGCTGVSALLEAFSSTAPETVSDLELIDYARIQLANSVDEARQAVWNLRGQHTDDFRTALSGLAERAGRSSNINVQHISEGDSFPFTHQAIYELMMISREAIYNAVLHAEPKQVTLRSIYSSREFRLQIADDGRGFDRALVEDGHYGLVGIKERVQQINGTLHVKSTAGQGTQIEITVQRDRLEHTRERV